MKGNALRTSWHYFFLKHEWRQLHSSFSPQERVDLLLRVERSLSVNFSEYGLRCALVSPGCHDVPIPVDVVACMASNLEGSYPSPRNLRTFLQRPKQRIGRGVNFERGYPCNTQRCLVRSQQSAARFGRIGEFNSAQLILGESTRLSKHAPEAHSLMEAVAS